MKDMQEGKTIKIGHLFFKVKNVNPLHLERFGTVYAYSETFGLEILYIIESPAMHETCQSI